MLNLRGVYIIQHGTPSEVDTERVSDLHFASQIVGNLGAPLQMGWDTPSDKTSTSWKSSSNASDTTAGSKTVANEEVAVNVVRKVDPVRESEEEEGDIVEVSVDPLSAGLGHRHTREGKERMIGENAV